MCKGRFSLCTPVIPDSLTPPPSMVSKESTTKLKKVYVRERKKSILYLNIIYCSRPVPTYSSSIHTDKV